MATRVVSIPPRISWGERVALPLLCLLLVAAAATSLGLALGRLPVTLAPRAEPRIVTLAAVRAPDALDPVAGVPDSRWPRSEHPVGGIAFVRCTNLWTAHADGSNARRILTMPGISSPAFSPDGRTIAFVVTTDSGTALGLAAADGSAVRSLGSLTEDGGAVMADIGSLEWSPEDPELAFTLAGRGIRGTETGHWVLHLPSGTFQRVGEGGDAQVWLGRHLLAAGRSDGSVRPMSGNEGWTSKRLSNAGDVQTLAFAPGWWVWEWDKQTALLIRDDPGSFHLAWRKTPGARRTPVETEPPAGHRFDPSGTIAVVQHGPVAVTLVDGTGERDLGLFDPLTRGWRVLNYAWDPSASPVPAAVGGVEAQRAVELARTLLWSFGRPDRTELLLESPVDPRLAPFDGLGFTLGDPTRLAEGWTIDAHTFGRLGDGFATRDLRVHVRTVDGRLAATVEPAGPLERVRSVEDAVRYLDTILTARVIAPAGLPDGTKLAPRAIDAWSWRGTTNGSLHLRAPGTGRLTFYYGESGFGCGASPIPLELPTGTPAIVTDPSESGGYNIIAWPAAASDSSGPFGIWGEVPTRKLVAMASAMDATGRT
jgi:hypothetical protein